MVLDLTLENINIYLTVSILILVYFISKIFIEKIELNKNILIFNIIFLILIYSFSVLSWYSLSSSQNSIFAFYSTIFETLKNGFNKNILFEKAKISRQDINSSQKLPNIIYIIGESATFSHTSFANYFRETTPNLDKLAKNSNILIFNNALSIGTKTRLSVPYMSVGLSGIDPKGEIYKYPNILNYAKSVGYKTFLITSQDLSWGGLREFLLDDDTDKFVNGTDVNPNARVHKGADDLEMLNREILPIIENETKPFFILFQMDGNHYPYSKHSPQNFKIWQENSENSPEAYDNSMRYSDEVLSKLINNMRTKFSDSWIFYSTDHGQNLGGSNGMFNDNFSLDVVRNLLFISAPEYYREKLKLNLDKPVSQADIVPTILDILNIKQIYKLNGISLLKNIDNNRYRVVSNFMPTLHNTPEASIFFHDLSSIEIDFSKMSAKMSNGKIIKFEDLNSSIKDIFLDKLK